MSIRQQILRDFVARLNTISGWAGQLRSDKNDFTTNKQVLAVVAATGERKQLSNSERYDAWLTVEVLVVGHTEDTDPTLDGGNPYAYLDRLVSQVEQAMHLPDTWGVNPAFTDGWVDGHQVQEPAQEAQIVAVVNCTFHYRHHYQDTSQ